MHRLFYLIMIVFLVSCNGKNNKKLVQPIIEVKGNTIVVLNYPDTRRPSEREQFDYEKLNYMIYDKLINYHFSSDEIYLVTYINYIDGFGYEQKRKYQTEFSISIARKYKNFDYWNESGWGMHSRNLRKVITD